MDYPELLKHKEARAHQRYTSDANPILAEHHGQLLHDGAREALDDDSGSKVHTQYDTRNAALGNRGNIYSDNRENDKNLLSQKLNNVKDFSGIMQSFSMGSL